MRSVSAAVSAALIGAGVLCGGSPRAQADSPRSGKRSAVSFRLATNTPRQGYEQLTVNNSGPAVYVAPRASFSAGDVVSTEAIASRTGSDVVLTLTDAAARRFGAALDKRGADRMAIFVRGNVFAAGELSFDARQGAVTITGLSPAQAERLTRVIKGRSPISTGAVVTLLPERTVIQPGEAVTVDVFISAANLRAYQASLDVTGGSAGRLVVEDLWIDTERADYVFGSLQKLDAVDQVGQRIGAVLFSGGVGPERAYAGSYSLRASPDASGTFNVRIKTQGNASLLTTPDVQLIRFANPSVAITVGASQRTRATNK